MAMMSLGMFVFELHSAPYQELQHQLAWRHASNSRVGSRPARQFCGPDDETVTLPGQLYPELTGGQPSLDELRDMGDTGQAYPLIDGTGVIYGQFVIESLNTTKSAFFVDGTPRKIDFTLKLTRVDDDKVNTRRNQTRAAR
jgi:phage protein U